MELGQQGLLPVLSRPGFLSYSPVFLSARGTHLLGPLLLLHTLETSELRPWYDSKALELLLPEWKNVSACTCSVAVCWWLLSFSTGFLV